MHHGNDLSELVFGLQCDRGAQIARASLSPQYPSVRLRNSQLSAGPAAAASSITSVCARRWRITGANDVCLDDWKMAVGMVGRAACQKYRSLSRGPPRMGE